MQLKYAPVFMILLIAAVFACGCTDSTSAQANNPAPSNDSVTATATLVPTPTHCYWDPSKMACSDHPITAAPVLTTIPLTGTPAVDSSGPDPIIHRWIREYPPTTEGYVGSGGYVGYEFRFFPEGTAVYHEGPVESTSSNLKIPSTFVTGTGSWTKLSEGHYLVKINTVNVSGSPLVPIVREYVLAPPSGIFPEHLVSDFEQTYVDTAKKSGKLHESPVDIFYLERAKTD